MCDIRDKQIIELRRQVAELKQKLAAQQERHDNQKMAMAEANLRMLEQSELLEEQKLKMAEANLTLLEQKEVIELERSRSEKLLLNVLPVKVADELKENGKTEPESFEDVTVFFSDIINFTKKASVLDPRILINELNDIFTAFDQIITEKQCERIKTIGDAYLCVCGMPKEDERHAENIVAAAIDIMRFLEKRNKSAAHSWEIRAGIHSGRVVGGVVGIEKYIYDVFGDTINTASRLESHSEAMAINVSEVTYQLVKDRFEFEERANCSVKGKGLLKMFYVKY